jgi:hypothetical protein
MFAALHAADTEQDHGGGPGGITAIAVDAGKRNKSEAINLIGLFLNESG